MKCFYFNTNRGFSSEGHKSRSDVKSEDKIEDPILNPSPDGEGLLLTQYYLFKV